MKIETIVKELFCNNIIQSECVPYEQLKGGTASEVYHLNEDGKKFVVKLNESEVTQSEAMFLTYYKEIDILPKLLYVEPSYKYIVYAFVNGSTNGNWVNKKEMLTVLVEELLNRYKPVPKDSGFGWADEPTDSWQSFLINEIVEANKILASRFSDDDYQFVCNLVNKNKTIHEPYLLHGDCGVHNFIFSDNKLSGVIDPTPVIGEPIYDLIYAFCSSPDDLTKETFDFVVKHLVIARETSHTVLYEQVLIGLYLRIASCIKHHPNDYEEYLKAWHYWKDVLLRKEVL